jgi:hypothetical protein
VKIDDVPESSLKAAPTQRLIAEGTELLAARNFREMVSRPDLVDLFRPPVLRAVDLHLPRTPAEGEQFRLLITEVEVRDVDDAHLEPLPDPGHDPRRRIVFVESVAL